jgi:hypothetical protein
VAEQLDLTTPVVPPSRTFYRITRLTLEWDNQAIHIYVTASDGTAQTVDYDGAAAVTRMQTLNTGNFSVNSLHKKCLQMMVTDGKLGPGTVSGTP